jgi:hypothetical protein
LWKGICVRLKFHEKIRAKKQYKSKMRWTGKNELKFHYEILVKLNNLNVIDFKT